MSKVLWHDGDGRPVTLPGFLLNLVAVAAIWGGFIGMIWLAAEVCFR